MKDRPAHRAGSSSRSRVTPATRGRWPGAAPRSGSPAWTSPRWAGRPPPPAGRPARRAGRRPRSTMAGGLAAAPPRGRRPQSSPVVSSSSASAAGSSGLVRASSASRSATARPAPGSPFGPPLPLPTAGTHLGPGRQEELRVGVREDDRSDVPALDHPAAATELTLAGPEHLPHRGMPGHPGDHGLDRLGRELVAGKGAVDQQLGVPIVRQLEPKLPRGRGQGGLVVWIQTLRKARGCERPIHEPRVEVREAQLGRPGAGQRALPDPAGPSTATIGRRAGRRSPETARHRVFAACAQHRTPGAAVRTVELHVGPSLVEGFTWNSP